MLKLFDYDSIQFIKMCQKITKGHISVNIDLYDDDSWGVGFALDYFCNLNSFDIQEMESFSSANVYISVQNEFPTEQEVKNVLIRFILHIHNKIGHKFDSFNEMLLQMHISLGDWNQLCSI